MVKPVISHWANASHGLDALLNPWILVFGLAVLFLARTLGILYTMNNIADETIRTRSRYQLAGAAFVFVVLFVVYLVHLLLKDGFAYDDSGVIFMEPNKYLHNMLDMWYLTAVMLIGVVLVLWGIIKELLNRQIQHFNLKSNGIWPAGIGTVLTVTPLLLMSAWNHTAYYPSTADLQSSLTLENSCSSYFTLNTMFWVSLLVPFVLAYIVYAWRKIDSKKIDRAEIASDDHAYTDIEYAEGQPLGNTRLLDGQSQNHRACKDHQDIPVDGFHGLIGCAATTQQHGDGCQEGTLQQRHHVQRRQHHHHNHDRCRYQRFRTNVHDFLALHQSMRLSQLLYLVNITCIHQMVATHQELVLINRHRHIVEMTPFQQSSTINIEKAGIVYRLTDIPIVRWHYELNGIVGGRVIIRLRSLTVGQQTSHGNDRQHTNAQTEETWNQRGQHIHRNASPVGIESEIIMLGGVPINVHTPPMPEA